MSEVVLDSSAVLALLLAEPGAAQVAEHLPDAIMSSVNAAEVISKLCEGGMPTTEAREAFDALGVDVAAFDMDLATEAGALRPVTRHLGLSPGDRACLALAARTQAAALTTDRAWQSVAGVNVVLIRP